MKLKPEFVAAAAQFCVPTAVSYLTGFSREAAIHGLAAWAKENNLLHTYRNGGWTRSVYLGYLKSRNKKIVEIGGERAAGRMAQYMPSGLHLCSGQLAGSPGGHCFIVWNGLIFDNLHTCIDAKAVNYFVWYYAPVVHSQFNQTMNNILKAAA